jgi:hypothetical protein
MNLFEIICDCGEVIEVTKELIDKQEYLSVECPCCYLDVEIEIEYDDNDEIINVYKI